MLSHREGRRVSDLHEEVEKIEMIIGLYFPSILFNKNNYYAGPTLPVLEIAVKEKRVSEQEAIDASINTKENIRKNAAEIKALCTNLMKKYRH